jgi:hypothetical protein
MKTKGVSAWKIVSGTLNEWNARQRPKFRIVQTGGIVNGVHVIGPRIAEDETGRTVAIEHATLSSTNCFVLKNLGKRTDGAQSTPETLSHSTRKASSGRRWA